MSEALKIKPLWEDLTLRRYLNEVATRMGVVEILALDNMRDLPRIRIESIYVPPLLAPHQVDAESDVGTWPQGQNLFDALEKHRRLVVLGDPGGGKTTLANWLAWRLSAGLASPLPSFLEDMLPLPCVLRELSPEVFSKKLNLIDMAEVIARRLLGNKTNNELVENIQARIKVGKYVLILDGVDEIPISAREVVRGWVGEAARQKACVLATSRIVGYDDGPVDVESVNSLYAHFLSQKPVVGNDIEFVSDSTVLKPRFIEWNADAIRTFMARDDHNGMNLENLTEIIGDRPWGDTVRTWEAAKKTVVWAERCYLVPFDDARISAFAANWYSQRCVSEIEAQTKASDLVAAVTRHEVTLRLARTPNLLTLMAVVHRERADLPDGKALLYDEIANAYINTIDTSRKLAVGPDRLAHHDWKERKSWLAYVGFRMQQLRSDKDEQSGILARSAEVCEWLAEAMGKSGVVDAVSAAHEYLGWIARRSGLLLPRGEGFFAFLHLSFQEYFCACYLAERIVSPAYIRNGETADGDVSRKKLRSWSDQVLWRETFVYLFEKLSADRDAGWVNDLAETLFKEENGNWFGGSGLGFHQALAARIAGDRHVRLRPEIKTAIIDSCVSRAQKEWHSQESPLVLSFLVDAGFACVVYTNNDASLEDHDKRFPSRAVEGIDELRSLTDLRLLIARGKAFSDISVLAELRALQVIDFSETKVSDLAPLSKPSGLTEIYFNETLVSDLSPLSRLTGLRIVELARTPVSDISALAGLGELRRLDLQMTEVKDFSTLSALAGLRTICLSNTGIADLSPLSKLTNLQSIDLSGTAASGFSPLAALPNLELLNLINSAATNFSSLAQLKQLRVLYLYRTKITDLSPLKGLSNLGLLWLGKTPVHDLSPLSGLTKLFNLDVEGTKVRNLSVLAKIKSISFLELGNTQISDLSPLANLPRLARLDIRSTQVKDISPLADLAGLSVLNLEDTLVSDLSPLSGLKYLREIRLAGSQVKDISPLSGLPGLKVLGFDKSPITKKQRAKKSRDGIKGKTVSPVWKG